MNSDWKLILKVVLGSALLILVVIYGLSKMAGSGNVLTVDQNKLVEGASLVKDNGEVKVTVVNFSDMECPACKRAHEMLSSLSSTPGVRLVFRHFPLSIHQYASIAASAVEAARLQGKGWEMIDLLYSKQDEWAVNSDIENTLVSYAKSLGLDENTFKSDLNSAEVAATVKNDIDLGDSLQLSGTPTIYVNGEQIGADFVVAKVNELLAK